MSDERAQVAEVPGLDTEVNEPDAAEVELPVQEYVHPETARMPVAMAEALRAPFPAAAVGKLPRVSCSACSKAQDRVCQRHAKQECPVCGNYMTTQHIHLDYVGHAAVTHRLLTVDPDWSWEPMALDPQGLPAIQRGEKQYRMWIRLTIGGVTRLGVGIAEAWKAEVEKELIGDAIRNAAMRFGVALDLWSKEDLTTQALDEAQGPPPPTPATHAQGGDPTNRASQEQITEVTRRLDDLPPDLRERFQAWKDAQGFPWPWPRAACAVMMRQIDALLGEGTQDDRGDTDSDAASGAGEALPPADPVPDGPCTICGSTRAERVVVRGVLRCARGSDCRKRAEARDEAAKSGGSEAPTPEAAAPAAPGGETGNETLFCAGCHEQISDDELPVFGDAEEPYHVACSPTLGDG